MHISFNIKAFFLAGFLCSLILLSSYREEKETNAGEKINSYFSICLHQLDSCLSDLSHRAHTISTAHPEETEEIRNAFNRCRLAFKRIEFISEYFAPHLSINKPFLPEINERDREMEPPQGFAVIENILYTRDMPASKEELEKEIYFLRENIKALGFIKEKMKDCSDSRFFDALRTEILRITALGLTGYDTPEAKTCLPESVAALESIHTILSYYYPALKKESRLALDRQFVLAQNFIWNNKNFESFDRLEFISRHLNPLSGLLLDIQRELQIPVYENPKSLIDFNAPHIFNKLAFHRFTDINKTAREEYVTKLGKMLFFDPVLSGNGKRSCASCHNPVKHFTDGLEKSIAYNFDGTVDRNAPTLLNAAIQTALLSRRPGPVAGRTGTKGDRKQKRARRKLS